ncbi:7249_t:CDS:2, partial [Funneliformis geosporum]
MSYVIANPEKSSQIFEEKGVDKTDVKFNDPDKEYEILDDGEYSNTDTFSNCPETSTTNTTENDNHETHDFCLDEFAMNYAKEYATSMVTDFEKEEVHVDWFGSDIDIQSELNGNGGNMENQCVIIDIVDETDTIAQQKKKQEKKIKVNSTDSITHLRKRQKFQEIEMVNEQCHGNMQE